jgi:hypothetical protein
VIVEANQAVSNYYLRVGTGGGICDGPNEQATAGNTKGAIISYTGAGDALPTSAAATLGQGCGEETGFVPFVETTVGAPATQPISLALTLDTTAGVFWKVNGVAIDIDWTKPSLQYIENGTYELPANDNGFAITTQGWQYLLITNDSPLPHPIHLHGHDFWIIAVGTGTGAGTSYNLTNAIRRDTHTVDGNGGTPGAGGFSVIAFQSDNPGAWLLHCHIPFHVSGGLGVQFLERPSEIVGTLGDLSGLNDGCSAWGSFASKAQIQQMDSGLKRRARTVRRH